MPRAFCFHNQSGRNARTVRTSTNKLALKSPLPPGDFIQLVAGTQIPRATTSADWPFLLLSPGENSVGVMAMRLLPREQGIFQQRAAR